VEIRAAEITIAAAQDRYTRAEESRFKRSGLTVAVGGPVVTSALFARDAVMRADDVQDSRLQAVYALRAARYGVSAVMEAQAVAEAPQSAQLQVTIGYGSSRNESSTRESWPHSSRQFPGVG
jgi:filamentous hemagglutinin